MNLLQSTAYQWVLQGFSIIPIRYYSKRPAIKSWEPYQLRLPEPAELNQWFRSSLSNIALITGWSNLVVIDFDIQDVFDYWFSLFPITTYMVKTRRGVHVYFQTEIKATNYHSPLLDIKAERGYILIPPSIHPSGYQYQVLYDAPIMKIDQLSDVLPGEFTPEPEKVVTDSPPGTEQLPLIDDPWADASRGDGMGMGIVDKIRGSLSILDLFPGAERTSFDGRWWVTACPFHDDANPSFWIDTVRGMCGCRVCNLKEMDYLNVYARMNGLSNRESIRQLAMVV